MYKRQDQGNYEYPEGFDSETGEWLPGYDAQREEWERQYAEARARFEAHRRQVEESRARAAAASSSSALRDSSTCRRCASNRARASAYWCSHSSRCFS